MAKRRSYDELGKHEMPRKHQPPLSLPKRNTHGRNTTVSRNLSNALRSITCHMARDYDENKEPEPDASGE